jgi:ankyrin repeat protein
MYSTFIQCETFLLFSQCGRTPVYCAATQGNEAMLRIVVNAGADLNLRDTEGLTPLMAAIREGATGMAMVLIKAGASLDRADEVRAQD